MTLKLTLTPELEQRLSREAAQRGVSADQWALHLLERSLPLEEHRAALVELLQTWIDSADPPGVEGAGDDLTDQLDEDRLSDRKLFPPELKGITW